MSGVKGMKWGRRKGKIGKIRGIQRRLMRENPHGLKATRSILRQQKRLMRINPTGLIIVE